MSTPRPSLLSRRALAGLTTIAVLAVPAAATALHRVPELPSTPVLTGPRTASPVVLTGKQLPTLSAPAPVPLRALYTDTEDRATFVPPDSSQGANVATGSLAVFAYRDGAFVEVPSQVDERFWRFLSNPGGESGELSGFDTELTYVFDTEGFRRTAGLCYASFPEGEPVTTPDTVAGFDDDDELAFMARDAGGRAPAGARPVSGVSSYEVTITDPTTEQELFAYVVSAPGRDHDFGPGYVSYERDLYGDRYTGVRGSQGIPEGPRCDGPDTGIDDGTGPTVGSTGARRPRDFATFRSDRYEFHFGGRWKPDGLRVAGTDGALGVDLIDQWKGRAFQQSQKQAVSIGFIGEKAWEESSVLLGERVGPVRAMRETWGAKSGTNITRLFTMYDQFLTDTINLRVHPIPPDGVYSMWDHNQGAVTTYYSPMVPSGVPIDGVDDENVGNLDVGVGTPAESHYDIADPTTQPYSAVEQWEQVAGAAGSVVYYMKNPRPGAAVITSYYRDDADFDDGSGSDPVGKQGSFGAHGMHIYATADTDNTPTGFASSELQVVTSQYPLVGDAGNVGEAYAAVERLPLTIDVVLLDASGEPEPTATATATATPTATATATATAEPTATATGKPDKPGNGHGKPTDKPGKPGKGDPTPTAPPAPDVAVGPVTTLPGSADGSDPAAAVDPTGVTYVGAGSGDGPLLWKGGPSFTALQPGGVVASLPRDGSAAVGIDPAGYLHTAAASAVGVTVSRSIDGGSTYDRGTPLAGLAPTGDPRLAVGRFNSGVEGATLTVAYPTATGVVVGRSLDGGLTFAPAVPATPGCADCAATLGDVVVDRGDDTRAWFAHGGSQGVFVARSTDSGVSFAPVAVAGGPVTVAPALARAADGTLAVVWSDGTGTRSSVSRDGGTTWSAPVVVGPATSAVGAAFTARGVLAVVTTSIAGSGTQPLVSVSRDSGTTFGPTVSLDAAGERSTSRIAVAGDSTETLRAVWQSVSPSGTELRTASVTP